MYADAFAADPNLAEDLPTGHRYNAARAAAQVGSGADGAKLSEGERVRWRKQACAWLRADLDAWASKLESGPAADRAKVQQALARWRSDPDLAGLCDPEALDRLPEAERQEWRLLWSDLDALLERAQASKKGKRKGDPAMSDDPRVEELLQELLDSSSTPEEVCRACPELLPQVRAGWQRLRAWRPRSAPCFPRPPPVTVPRHRPTSAELPRIRGYEVQGVLGHGGMGVVYKAWHRRLNRPVALKMLLAGPYARPEELERFLREAEAVAGLRHANIVQVHDVGDVDGRPYFTMEFVEGGSLAQKLAGTPQPAGQAAALLATLAEAVQAAHQSGIVHRDLKPANILLTADGTPKITDFGLARRLEDGGGLTLTGSPVGTPSYMAPEQARGNKDAIGPATDVYALGAILYEC